MTPILRKLSLLALLVATACQQTPDLPRDASAALHLAADQPESLGALIYEGDVAPRDAMGPALFRYERRVLDLDDRVFSSHLSFSAAGVPIVLHQAEHSQDYQLIAFEEIHAQTGLVGHVRVDSDGTAHFETTVDGRTRTRTEAPGDPLHVGPTLFGYVLMNWDSLVAGDIHPIRFAVLENQRSYGFKLREVDGRPGTTTFEMAASSVFVSLGVPSMTLEFDPDRNILSYAGWVPPLEEVGDRLKKLDATVTYVFAVQTYQ